MGFYENQVLPRFTDVALGRSMEPTRARVSAGLSGSVLELGFGSGRNLPHMSPDVERVLIVEPAAGGQRLARRRIAAAPFPVEFVGSDAQELGLPDESIDHILVTWTLCSIPDVHRALLESRRVLRPEGTMHFVEHGRAPDPRLSQRQDRLTPLWRKVFGGCHINRAMDELISTAGFQLDELRTYSTSRGDLAGFMYEGVASKSP